MRARPRHVLAAALLVGLVATNLCGVTVVLPRHHGKLLQTPDDMASNPWTPLDCEHMSQLFQHDFGSATGPWTPLDCEHMSQLFQHDFGSATGSLGQFKALASLPRCLHVQRLRSAEGDSVLELRYTRMYGTAIAPTMYLEERCVDCPAWNTPLGGSTFSAVVVQGLKRAICAVEDSLNGVYRIDCPQWMMPATRLEVELQSILWNAYFPVLRVNDTVYTRATMNIPILREVSRHSLPDEAVSQKPTCNAVLVSQAQRGFWHGNASWEYETCVVEHVEHDEIQRCVARYERVVLVGASHMRYTYDALVDFMHGDLMGAPRKHLDASHQGMEYRSVLFVEELTEFVEASTCTNCVLVLQAGSWDFGYRGGLSTFIPDARKLITALQRLMSTEPHAAVIYVSAPPYPIYNNSQSIKDVWSGRMHRDTSALRASTEWLQPQLTGLGVAFLDYGLVAEAYASHVVCGNHYACRVSDDSTVEGFVGLQIAQVLVNMLCS